MNKNTSSLTLSLPISTYPPTATVSDTINIVLLAQEFSPLTFISIASGEKISVTEHETEAHQSTSTYSIYINYLKSQKLQSALRSIYKMP